MNYLSVVLPAFNESRRLDSCLSRLTSFLWEMWFDYEIIVVENGSSDGTLDIANRWAYDWPEHIRVLHLDRRGKGFAVRTGMLAAEGKYRYMADIDLSAPPEEIPEFLRLAESGYDVVIGSRRLAGSDVQSAPLRKLLGRGFHAWASHLAPGIQDTQCGFKMFSAAAAENLFSLSALDGYAFDVEVLYLAFGLGYHVLEHPVLWTFNPDSRVSLMDIPAMARDVLRIPRLHPKLSLRSQPARM